DRRVRQETCGWRNTVRMEPLLPCGLEFFDFGVECVEERRERGVGFLGRGEHGGGAMFVDNNNCALALTLRAAASGGVDRAPRRRGCRNATGGRRCIVARFLRSTKKVYSFLSYPIGESRGCSKSSI